MVQINFLGFTSIRRAHHQEFKQDSPIRNEICKACITSNSLPNDRFLDISTWETFAVKLANVTQFLFSKFRKHCRKRRICRTLLFSSLPAMFSKSFFYSSVVKSGRCVLRNSLPNDKI